MKVAAVFGFTKSGKTTTVEHIVAELRARGYSVGSVKDIHNELFAIDEEGTNTDRHKKAGSQLVTARGLFETDILFQERLPIKKLLDIYKLMYDFDYVVLEGENEFKGKGIVCGHDLDEVDRKWEKAGIDVFAVSGVISAEIEGHRGVPAINAMTDAALLTDLFEENAQPWEEIRDLQE